MKNKNELIQILVNSGLERNEAAIEIELILENILNKTREELLFINEFDEKEILPVVLERANLRCPVQYILKNANFMGENYYVDENVLIPRDETELLVREVFKYLSDGIKILDIGTGSGIIACSLGLFSKKRGFKIEVLGVDISNAALNIAINNMKKLNLTRTCLFRKSDIFSNIREDEKFDIIVSNPPYIPKNQFETIQKEVKFEPYNALFTDDEDGLYFYKKIIKETPKFLNKKGFIFYEMMKGQHIEISKILSENGFYNIEIVKDMQGIERVIKAQI